MITFSANIKIDPEERNSILKSLPEEWKTQVYYFCPDKNKEVHIKIDAKTIGDTKRWLSDFQKLTNTFYSVYSGYNSKGKRVKYKKIYHCHHNTRHKETYDPLTRRSVKNTKCPSSIIISIRKIITRYQGKYRAADPTKPCEIKIKMQHNHPLDTPEILRFNKVSPEVKEELLSLFSNDHNASSALKQLKTTIKQNNSDYEKIFADRSKCPDYSYCYNLYLKFQQKYNSDEIILTKLFDKYNVEKNDISAEMAVGEDGIVVCLCPPVAKRAHQFKNSGKIVFVDCFTSHDNTNNNVYLFLTPSEIGCLPLAAMITNTSDEITATIGLSLLKDMLDNTAFAGHVSGPDLFLTDENLAKNNILTSIWPKSKVFFNTFHVLKNVWHWLSDPKNNIANEDRALLFRDFYNILYAQDEYSFSNNFRQAHKSKYDNYSELLENYYENKEKWAVHCQPDILKLDNSNIKFSEISIRFLHCNLFQDFKNFKFIPIINYIIDLYFPYFEQRCLDISTNRIPSVFFTHLEPYSDKMLDKMQSLDKSMKLLPSKKTKGLFYVINTSLLTCTCSKANADSFCKHVQYVTIATYQETFKTSCKNDKIRKKCYYLLTGNNLGADTRENIENNLRYDESEEEDIEMNHTISGEECLKIAEREETKQKCIQVWENITTTLGSFIETSCADFAPIIDNIASKFNAVDTVEDLRSSFNIFDPVPEKNYYKTIRNEKSSTEISDSQI